LRQVSGDDFEKVVLQQLSAVFRTPSILAKTYDAVSKNADKERASLLERQDELVEKLDSLQQEMFQSSDTASHGELDGIKEEMVKLDTELKPLEESSSLAGGEQSWRQKKPNIEPTERLDQVRLLRRFHDNILFAKGKKALYLFSVP